MQFRDDEIRPARMVQVQEAWDHGFDLIEPDVGGVVEALQRHDKALGVRLGKQGAERAWIVFRKHCPVHPDYQHDCQDCRMGVSRDLVTSRRAWQNRSGTWEGLTHEVVDAVCTVDEHGRSGYDFVKEVDRRAEQAEKDRQERVRRRVEEHAEEFAHAIRKDLGERYRGRAFITRKP